MEWWSGGCWWGCPAEWAPSRWMRCTPAAALRPATPGCSAATLGLSLAEAKAVLAGLQHHLVRAQAEEHCQVRRRCPRCGGQRPLKDRRPRQLRSLFGTVEVRAPRFEPCQCSVALRTILSPVKAIMPDCCTPEYELVLAQFGALLLYRRARALLETFFPLGDLPTIDTIQRRTLRVGARLKCAATWDPLESTCRHASLSIL